MVLPVYLWNGSTQQLKSQVFFLDSLIGIFAVKHVNALKSPKCIMYKKISRISPKMLGVRSKKNAIKISALFYAIKNVNLVLVGLFLKEI